MFQCLICSWDERCCCLCVAWPVDRSLRSSVVSPRRISMLNYIWAITHKMSMKYRSVYGWFTVFQVRLTHLDTCLFWSNDSTQLENNNWWKYHNSAFNCSRSDCPKRSTNIFHWEKITNSSDLWFHSASLFTSDIIFSCQHSRLESCYHTS